MLSTKVKAAKQIASHINIHDATRLAARTTPAFAIGRANGFLPRADPTIHLPKAFAPLESLLERMTLVQPDGSKGLLARGQFGDAVKTELKGLELDKEIDKVILSNDQMMLSALFRDYCFATSAYLLEPVDLSFKKTGQYCEGRSTLPPELAVPITKLAKELSHAAYMEYASSYALYNWKRKDPKGPIAFDNLDLIRAFENLQGSERGFILVHVDMVAYSGALVAGAEDALAAAAAKDRPAFDKAMEDVYETYQKINVSMQTMWTRSKVRDYLAFRSFIFGTKGPKEGNPMFPNGVVYEGVSDEPQYYRGESGANDNLVPLGDNLLEITASMPNNPLTDTLRDFRKYRPPTQREYIASVESRATAAGVKAFAAEDPKSLALYALNVDQINEFRTRHWSFTRNYIIRSSTYGLATGGSPILRYLPRNLAVTRDVLLEAISGLPSSDVLASKGLPENYVKAIDAVMKRAPIEKAALDAEMGVWQLVEEQAENERLNRLHGGEKALAMAAAREKEYEEKSLKRGSVGCDGVG